MDPNTWMEYLQSPKVDMEMVVGKQTTWEYSNNNLLDLIVFVFFFISKPFTETN